MAKRKHTEEDDDDAGRWLLTYADLITLLLAFFIVMYSMSRIDAKKFGRMQKQLSSVLRGGATIFPNGEITENEGAGMLKIGDLKILQARIQKMFLLRGPKSHAVTEAGLPFDKDVADAISTEIGERGLIIHVKNYALFESGKADLKPKAKALLGVIADQIEQAGNHICIEGHTDNAPINTLKFPSNWELSAARATNVVRFFVDEKNYPPEKISARGFGEFRPIASNATTKGMALNRRVDIVLLSPELSIIEPQSKDRVAEAVPPALPDINLIDSFQQVSALPDKVEQ